MSNNNLACAKNAKNDEFYTQYKDIKNEVDAYVEYKHDLFSGKTILLPCDNYKLSNFSKYFLDNFDKYGVQKLICTCYNKFEKGIAFIKEKNKDPLILNLSENGDFRSSEINDFLDIADFVITNPPFSLYREFVSWLTKSNAKFLVVGNKNSVTYKEIFPLILNNKLWSGVSKWSGGMWFYTQNSPDKLENVASTWFTNIEHGRRHKRLKLSSMEENISKGKHKRINEHGYLKYDNYDALEVPYSDAIPSDYKGAMGVPITFLEKYNPDQFRIIGASESEGKGFSNGLWDEKSAVSQPLINGKRVYKRFFIIPK